MAKGLQRAIRRGPDEGAPAYSRRITVVNKTIDVTATADAEGLGTLVIGDFPQGNILWLGGVARFKIDGPGDSDDLSNTWEGDYAVGTAVSTGGSAGAELIASTALAAADDEAGVYTRGVSTSLGATVYDNTDGSLEINLNVIVDAADITDDATVTLTVNGTLDYAFLVLGDD